jgi:cytochrome P450
VEEIVRYSSPVVFMRRTLTQDYAMNGQDYRKDDKVVLYYNSANRDEAVFPDPSASTSPARPTRTSGSAARARTTASAPTWPAASSG